MRPIGLSWRRRIIAQRLGTSRLLTRDRKICERKADFLSHFDDLLEWPLGRMYSTKAARVCGKSFESCSRVWQKKPSKTKEAKPHKRACKGKNKCKGAGRLQDQRRGLRGQELLQGQGWLQGSAICESHLDAYLSFRICWLRGGTRG